MLCICTYWLYILIAFVLYNFAFNRIFYVIWYHRNFIERIQEAWMWSLFTFLRRPIFIWFSVDCNVAPACSPGFQVSTIDEGLPVGTLVKSLVCTDPDTGLDGQLTYTVAGGDITKLTVDATGDVTTKAIYNYETNPKEFEVIICKWGSHERIFKHRCASCTTLQHSNCKHWISLTIVTCWRVTQSKALLLHFDYRIL